MVAATSSRTYRPEREGGPRTERYPHGRSVVGTIERGGPALAATRDAPRVTATADESTQRADTAVVDHTR
ncbi:MULTISPECIES: hypothetical protein [Haloarcula]|uniref:hypothetical protein n=1 Tax=Haloarcula TaxID=2237 RepID=UPI0016696B54|nr:MULTISPECIES: hypothetical protein [Halomicroarcula]MBX0349796.1 hypothetical protein [Halomicroarcula pellucida]MDS0279539.1 hypothetical protein [Halomicroarcula sp. S1AR25-4]